MTLRIPRARAALAGLALLVCFSPPLARLVGVWPLQAQAQAQFEVLAGKDTMIAMRDGVRLATDIYRPARNGAAVEGKFPAILERTPYGKDRLAGVANYFAPRGYVVVLQDVRARYKSEGRIGTVGTSYDGGAQHAMAIANAPYLKAMIPVDAMSDFGRYGVRHNGAFELRWFSWVFTLGNSAETQSAPAAAARAVSDPAAAAALVDLGTRVRDY